jgi:hypothetical protein
MKDFVAVVRREIAERKLLLAAAALCSLIPLATPLMRGLAGENASDARSSAAFLLSIAFAVGTSIGLGCSMLVFPTANRRIAFDFSRPLSGFAIWGGRFAAAMVLAAATAAIVWLPALLAGARLPLNDLLFAPDLPRAWPLLALVGLALLFSSMHAVALVLRSRSGLIALDAALAVLAGLGISTAFSRLPLYRAEVPFHLAAISLAFGACLAFLTSGYASVARGRTDIRSAHRALSTVLWTVFGVVVITANAYTTWVSAATPGDLGQAFWVAPADSGPWVTLSGPARGTEATFVYNSASGQFARVSTPDWRGPILSRNGKLAAWAQAVDRGGPIPICTLRLDVAKPQPVRTRLRVNNYPALLVLSEDGARLAASEAGALSIYDLGEGRVLASANVPPKWQRLEGRFISRDVFRIFRGADGAVDILQLDIRSRSLATLGRVEGVDGLRSFITDAEGERLVALDGKNRGVRLFDASTGALLATLADAPADARWPAFLPDGRIVLSERSLGGRLLRVFSADGREEQAIALPPASSVALGGEVAAGKLCIGVDDGSRSESWLVDLDNPSLRKVADDLRPVTSLWTTVGLGSDATRLFYGPAQRSLVRFDPLTGERRLLLGGR